MATVYHAARRALATGKLDLGGPLYAMLVSDTYAQNRSHRLPEIRAAEVNGKGYKAGGQKLSSRLLERGGELVLVSDDAVWPDATITARRVVVHDGETPLCCLDLDELGTSTNGEFRVRWSSEGIFRWAA